MRAPLLAAVLLTRAARLAGSLPAPCDAGGGSCRAGGGPASEVGAQEAEEATALRVELLQKARVVRRGDIASSVLQAGKAEDCTDSDDGLQAALAPFGVSVDYCSDVADRCNAWIVGSVIRSKCCATCSQADPSSTQAPSPAPTNWPDTSSTQAPPQAPTTWSVPSLALASRVCVSNRGGFKLGFELWDTHTNQRIPTTDTYASGGRDCRDIGDIPMVEGGHPIVTVVFVTAGKTISLSPFIYDPLAGSENITCRGGTGTPRCVTYLTDGSSEEVQQFPAPDLAAWQPVRSASGICLMNSGGYRLRFQLWNTARNSLSNVSSSFDFTSYQCIPGHLISEVQDGNPMVPITYVQGGGPLMFHSVIYDVNATAAVYVCRGGTGSYSCELIGY